MSGGIQRGAAEARAIDSFLMSAAKQPSALILDGEPGIGKTTLWVDAIQSARQLGFRVLSTRSSAAESQLAYAGVGDLLREIPSDVLMALPKPQRLAVDQVLMRAESQAPSTDPRATSAALLAIVERLALHTPVLVAVDDVQWIDPSSANALAFAIRRLLGRVGLLATARVENVSELPAGWLQLPPPETVVRHRVKPMDLSGLRRLVTGRIGRELPRASMAQIQQVSNGNPFYALELARSMDGAPRGEGAPLPATLTELVRAHVGEIGDDVRQALLAVACLAKPTFDLVQAATEFDDARLLALLEDAERRGVVAIDGHHVGFTHPLLAAGVFNAAEPGQRRQMHRRLAALVVEPELQARHLALASVRGDGPTLAALDAAAQIARRRGAPAAAAELLNLAIRLGGAAPERRLVLATHLLDAGESQQARQVLESSLESASIGSLRARTLRFLGIVRLHDDSYAEAAEILERASEEVGEGDVALLIECLTWLAYAQLNSGQLGRGLESVDAAVAHAERHGDRHLISHAKALQLMLRFIRGDGLNELELERALDFEDPDASGPVPLKPSTEAALLHAWTGRLSQGASELEAIRRRCVDLGDETALSFLDFHLVLIEIWRGNVAEGQRIAEQAFEQALQGNADVLMAVARTSRAMAAAYAGRVEDARRDANEALATYLRCGWMTLATWPVTVLAFVELSLGDYQAALDALGPLLAVPNPNPHASEVVSSGHLPDAVEVLIRLGRLDEAEAILTPFEANGRRLDRSWVLATAARCRSLLEAARGELDGAYETAIRAMVEHRRVDMPFERARTQLILGQLQRRRRQKDPATLNLGEALETFERLGNPLWAERCRAELNRVPRGTRQTSGLTPSEQRVAELAAEGLTNGEVAAKLFISPKTVENNLARVYRKLGIRSRAELGRTMAGRQSD